MELIQLNEVHGILEEMAKEAIELYRYQLSLGGAYGNKNASRELWDSLKTQVKVNGASYEIVMTLAEYWKYIEGGAKGKNSSPAGAVYPAHFPPVDELVKWINVKPIIPRPYDGKIPSPEELAYLIGRKIHNEGIEPFPAMATTKEELMKIYRERLTKALGHDVEWYIRKVYAE